jgi:hypothetical protein
VRKLPLVFGCILIVYGSGRILLDTKLRDDPWLEKLTCRFFLCSDDLVLEKAVDPAAREPQGLLRRVRTRARHGQLSCLPWTTP